MNSVDILDHYTLFEDGSVISKERVVRTASRGTYIRRQADMHPHIDENGYHRMHFRAGGKQVSKYLHKLVAENFLLNPCNFKYVRHSDGDRDNNHVNNLEWVPHG